MFVNFCSKLAFMKFNRLTFINHKERHIITYRRPRISSKMLPTFSNSAWTNELRQAIQWSCQWWATVAVYRPVLTGCLPLKCYIFIVFLKNIIFCCLWVWICRLHDSLLHQTRDVFYFNLIYSSLARQLVVESTVEFEFFGKTSQYFDLAYKMQLDASCTLQLCCQRQIS